MAKKTKTVSFAGIAYSAGALALLEALKTATDGGSFLYISPNDDANALLTGGLISVDQANINPQNAEQAAATITDAGRAVLAPKPASDPIVGSSFTLMSNIPLPEAKRGKGGGAGAPSKYPFDTMEIGNSFFVPVSADMPDPVKTMQSTVSSTNLRFSEETGQTKTVTRTKRGEGNKAVVGPDGKNVQETVQVPVRKQVRKFAIRSIKAGQVLGTWTAPSDGALIARVPVE